MLCRDEWLDLARDLDWDYSYVKAEEVFPPEIAGSPWLPFEAWADWQEPYRTTYGEYVQGQHSKTAALQGVQAAIGGSRDFQALAGPWLSALKLYSATFSLAEFAAVVGNLRGARFGRTGAWRTMANLGALDEIRHTEIPLLVMHELVRWDAQFDWVHRFYHTNNWVAIAARHLVDELLLGSTALEYAVATNFVFESGFTNLQFVGLAALAQGVGDHMFEEMGKSIQSDEARHAQIGPPVLRAIVAADPVYAQRLVDKWFWRSWRLFAVVTGFSMDYLTPVEARRHSFKEFMEEWILEQFVEGLEACGLKKPWYWDSFLHELDYYHHMVYASAYSYRATVWFSMPLPGPTERRWLEAKYPASWLELAPVWQRLAERWQEADPGLDMGVHGTAIIGFCRLCQIVLSGGTPQHNAACFATYQGQEYLFCSEPCRWIFEQEPERYAQHKDLVQRVLSGEAPANLLAMLTQYFGLTYDTWGKDSFQGDYPWLQRSSKAAPAGEFRPKAGGGL